MTQNRYSRPESRLRLGGRLARQSRRLGLTNEDAEAFDQTRDRTPAEPLSFVVVNLILCVSPTPL